MMKDDLDAASSCLEQSINIAQLTGNRRPCRCCAVYGEFYIEDDNDRALPILRMPLKSWQILQPDDPWRA